MSNKTIIRLDASALVQSSCLLRLKRITMDGYTFKVPPNDMVYGSAFHKFVSTMYETAGSIDIAISKALEIWNKPKEPRNKFLTEQHLINTCVDYWQHFQTKDNFEVFISNGKPLVEVDFSNKYYEDNDYEVWLEGTVDKYGRIKNGINAFGDYKTHSLSSVSKNGSSYINYNIEEYFRRFELSCQLNFYGFNTMFLCKQNPEHPISKLFLGQPIGYFIDGVFMSSKEKTIFRRSTINQFTEYNYNKFKLILDKKIHDYINYLRYGDNMMDGLISGSCNEQRYPCMFYNVCAAQDDMAVKFTLESSYIKKQYSPLEFSK